MEECKKHRIRHIRFIKVAGIPAEMHFLPEYYGFKKCGIVITTVKKVIHYMRVAYMTKLFIF